MAGMVIVGGGLAGVAAAHALTTFGDKGRVCSRPPRLWAKSAPQSTSARKQQSAVARSASARKSRPSAPHRPASTRATCRPANFSNSTTGSRPRQRYGAPYYTFHRADLLDALASGLDRSADPSWTSPVGIEEQERPRRARVRQWRPVEAEFVIGCRRGALGHPPGALWRGQPDLYGPDGMARAARRQQGAARRAGADRTHPMGRPRLPSPCLLHPRRQAFEYRHPGGHRQMGRGRLVDPRRSRRDALELSQSRSRG